jgi:hemerythrin-like domain-containing protein
MNAIELLKDDHQMALGLIRELESADDQMGTNPTHTETFNKLHQALKLHSRMEEEIFYPALASLAETRELIAEAYQEHEQVDELLVQLSSQSPNEEEFQDDLAELRIDLEHHIEEEETEIFPQAEQLLGLQQLEEMGRQMQAIKGNSQQIAATMRRQS